MSKPAPDFSPELVEIGLAACTDPYYYAAHLIAMLRRLPDQSPVDPELVTETAPASRLCVAV